MKNTRGGLVASNVCFDAETTVDRLVAHGGLGVLGRFADSTGLIDAFSAVVPYVGRSAPVFDRGRLLGALLLMLADGGECCTDFRTINTAAPLLAATGSERTLRRMIADLAASDGAIGRVQTAVNETRNHVWRANGWTNPGQVTILDLDSTLIDVHTEKSDAAATYKRGFGFHPVWCFADRTGETLAVKWRPGNAGANTITDLIETLDLALDALPVELADRHRPGAHTPTGQPATQILVRSDSAAATNGLLWQFYDRDIRFSVTGRNNRAIETAILSLNDTTRSEPALDAPYIAAGRSTGRENRGQVTELTDHPNIAAWIGPTRKRDADSLRLPPGTRVIVRREPLHPGAQQRLFDTDGLRHTIILADTPGVSAVAIDLQYREHARVEAHIKSLKQLGMERFPFDDAARNQVWIHAIGWTQTLLAWWANTQLAGTEIATAEPKRLRYTILHTPALLVSKARRLHARWPTDWPWTPLIFRLLSG